MAKIELNSNLALYTNGPKTGASGASATRKLIVSTHGGWSPADGTFDPRGEFGVSISFYSKENYSVTGDVQDALTGAIQTIDAATTRCKNYELTRFEHDPSKKKLEPHLNGNFDVLKVRSRWIGKERRVHLKEVLRVLSDKGYKYSEVCCLFCRYTGSELSMDARQRTPMEAERVNNLAKATALNNELKSKFTK